MKLSDALVKLFSVASDSPGFAAFKSSEDGKETIKLMKSLYKEIMAVEAEGKKFDGEVS